MATTDLAFMAGEQQDVNLSDHVSRVEDAWDAIDHEMNASESSETVYTSYTNKSTSDMLDDLIIDDGVQSVLSNHDAVVVVTNETYDDIAGLVDDLGTAYQSNGVAIITGWGNSKTSVHEVGHLYNGRHSKANEWGLWEWTVLADGDTQSCNDKDPDETFRVDQYGDCNISRIESFIEDNS